MSHDSSGACLKCQMIFDTYPGFHADMREWFDSFQATHPEAHISCAGRGKADQENLFLRKATLAHYGQSAHNYNAAIDLFVMIPGEKTIYPEDWFLKVLLPLVPLWVTWGHTWVKFPELPHLEVTGWEHMANSGSLHIVE